MPDDAAYDRDPGAFHEDPGPGPCCHYCQFGPKLGEVRLDLPDGWQPGDPVPPENAYHEQCRQLHAEYLAAGGQSP